MTSPMFIMNMTLTWLFRSSENSEKVTGIVNVCLDTAEIWPSDVWRRYIYTKFAPVMSSALRARVQVVCAHLREKIGS